MHHWVHCSKHGIDYIEEDGCPKCLAEKKPFTKSYNLDKLLGATGNETTADDKDWTCVYCDALNPKSQFNCHNCGAPRRHKDTTDARKWEPDIAQLGKIDL